MKFNTLDELTAWVQKNLDSQIVSNGEIANYKKIGQSMESREELRKIGFFRRSFIWGRIGMMFNNFKCQNCNCSLEKSKLCAGIQNIIKSL